MEDGGVGEFAFGVLVVDVFAAACDVILVFNVIVVVVFLSDYKKFVLQINMISSKLVNNNNSKNNLFHT